MCIWAELFSMRRPIRLYVRRTQKNFFLGEFTPVAPGKSAPMPLGQTPHFSLPLCGTIASGDNETKARQRGQGLGWQGQGQSQGLADLGFKAKAKAKNVGLKAKAKA